MFTVRSRHLINGTHLVCALHSTPRHLQSLKMPGIGCHEDKRPRTMAASGVPASQLQPSPITTIQGFSCKDHWIDVPLDHEKQDGRKIRVFAREVSSVSQQQSSSLPLLCYFQGGPGIQSPSPSDGISWLNSAVKHFRVVLLDQRGTGKSSPIRQSVLEAQGDDLEQAEYLRHFRADSIVKDAEMLRKHLSGLQEVFITGGIPPAIDESCAAETVYKNTFHRVVTQNAKYYERFPEDVGKVKAIVSLLNQSPDGGILTPAGNWLKPRSLQMLGMSTLGSGGAGGGFETLHFMIDSAIDYTGFRPEITPQFLKAFDSSIPFDTNPVYALLHEACYSTGGASMWAAQRVRDQQWATDFNPMAAASSAVSVPVLFTGEMIFPWMFEDLAALRPMRGVAEVLAQKSDWSSLYDSQQLKQNAVPVAAAMYVEDMFVDFNLAQETAKKIKGIRQWMTNEFQHSGIRDDGGVIFERLLSFTRKMTVNF